MLPVRTHPGAAGVRGPARTLFSLLGLLIVLVAPRGVRAAGPTITSLYTTTVAAAEAAAAGGRVVPPGVSSFAKGTTAVAAVFSYGGARAYSGSQFQLEVYARAGGILGESPFHLFVRASGRYALIARHGPPGHPDGKPFPAGRYQATLVIDGTKAASVPFTVGAARRAPGPAPAASPAARPTATATARVTATATATVPGATPTPVPTSPPATPMPAPTAADRIVPGQGLVTFYITSLAASQAWAQNHASLPTHVRSFAPGTRSVAGYFAYADPALLDHTYEMTIRDAAGAVVSTSTFFLFLHTQGAAVLVGTHGMAGATVLSDNKPFAPGRYQAALSFSGHGVVGTATFAVGTSA